MYMPDCIKATIDVLKVPSKLLKQRTYNIAACSFTPKELANEVKKYIPDLEVTYNPDFRQKIADTWPKRLDDTNARRDWGWKEEYGLEKMAEDMVEKVKILLGK